jgi:integrase/recombinase XerD
MPKHFIINNNGYWYEAWYESSLDSKRKLKKRPIHDEKGRPVKDKREAFFLLYSGKHYIDETPGLRRTTFNDFIPLFRKYLVDKGKKERTIKLYLHDIEEAKEHLPSYLQDVRLDHIEEYLSSLNFRPATKTRYAKSISRLFSVARRLGKIQINPIEGFEFVKYKPEVNPYTEEEVDKLINVAKELEENFNEPYHTFIILALQTGLRLDEYVNLRWKYLDIKKGSYTICADETWRPKHDHKRIIIIPKLSLGLLMKLPKVSEYIFHKNKSKHHHFSRDFVNNIFKAAGVIGDLHQIRKTVASYRLACGQPIQNLKLHLGHNSLRELECYVGTVVNVSEKIRKIFGEY